MKKNNKKIILVILMSLFFTGCTIQFKGTDGKVVKNPETGQNLTSNILCKPTSSNVTELYNNNGKDLSSLPNCKDYSIEFNNYDGKFFSYLWEKIFIQPLAWLIIKIGEFLIKLTESGYGLSIIITTLMIRFLMFPVTKKSAEQAEKMKLAQPELKKLEEKYKNNNDREAMMLKSQEMMAIYKKHGISATGGCLFAFIQIPLFFAYYESISRIPVIFETSFFGFQLGTSPSKAISNGQWYYIIFIILIVVATYYSFKLNGATASTPEQEKQMKMMMNYMLIFILVSSIFLPTGIAVYWVTNNAFTIGQNLLMKRGKKK